jgi:TPR repeat protein
MRDKFEQGVVENWDETLLCRVLLMMPCKASVRRAIETIRSIRNELSHNSARRLDSASFDCLFSRLRDAALVLDGALAAQFDALRGISLDDDCEAAMANDSDARRYAIDCRAEGDRLASLSDWAAAADSYSRGIERRGVIDSRLAGRLYVKRSIARFADGQLDIALTDAAEAVKLDGQSCDAHCQLGECHKALRQWPAASLAFETAHALAPPLRRAVIHSLLMDSRSSADHMRRREHENAQFMAGMPTGARAAMAASQGSESGRAMRDWHLPEHLLADVHAGVRHIIEAKRAIDEHRDADVLRHFLTAAEGYQNAEAMYNLAVIYSKGRCGVAKDRVVALDWARRAIDCQVPAPHEDQYREQCIGVAHAHTLLGNWYNLGLELPLDEAKSLHHWRAAFAIGRYAGSGAANMLGICCEHGSHNVIPNIADARDYYRIACNGGLRANEAMQNLGALWLSLHSKRNALPWFKAARAFGVATPELISQIAQLEGVQDEDFEAAISAVPAEIRPILEEIDSAMRQEPPHFTPIANIPSLDELQRFEPRSPYLELLLQSKRIAAQIVAQLQKRHDLLQIARLAARVLLTPDSVLVRAPEENAALFVVATLVLKSPAVASELAPHELAELHFHASPHHDLAQSLVTLRRLTCEGGQFPDNVMLLERLGHALAFSGPHYDPRASLECLNKALALVKKRQAEMPFAIPIRLGLLQSIASVQSYQVDEPDAQDRRRQFLQRYISECVDTGHGHRKFALACFKMAFVMLEDRDNAAAQQYYERGVKALVTMPPFLRAEPEQSNYKRMLDSMFSTSQIVLRGGALLRVSGVDSRWFQGSDVLLNYLRTEERVMLESKTKERLIGDSTVCGSMAVELVGARRSSAPDAGRDAQRTPIFVDELVAACADVVYELRLLHVVVVSAPVQIGSQTLHCFVEDGRRAAVAVALYNVAPELCAQLAVGCVVQIRDPYCRIFQDETIGVRVDHPREAIVVQEKLNLCWMCLSVAPSQSEPLSACSACHEARYCTRECQKKHFREYGHKHWCSERCRPALPMVHLTLSRK